jgi:hypothetical protein
MKPHIDTRSTRWPRQDCHHCKLNQHDSHGAHHQSIVQIMLAQHGFTMITDWRPRAAKVEARVNNGQWMANCPLLGCAGAETVDPDWPLFVCTGCGCGPFEVIFPKERKAIEAALVKRPVLRTREWFPHESAADLQRENAEHADEIAMALA